MLVLTRKKGESIILGDDIEITVIDVEGDQIKLGITAPKYVDIHRKEIYMLIKNENELAAKRNVSIIDFQKFLQKKNNRDT